MTTLYLIRHGQTDWNVEGRYQGQTDVPLNEAGRIQAGLLAARLAGMPFEAIYSSDLKRAMETAQALADITGLAVHPDRRLREIYLAEWQGLLIGDIQAAYGDHFNRSRIDPWMPRSPGGESVAQVAERTAHAANDICRAYPVGPVLVVAHGLALATLICQSRGLSLAEAYAQIPDNCQPVVIRWLVREDNH